MSALQVKNIYNLIRVFYNDITDCIQYLSELVDYLEEYNEAHGELTKELIREQIDFNFEEIEEYIGGFITFKDWLREIIDGGLDEDSRNAEIYVD